jgi:hypothetical protein
MCERHINTYYASAESERATLCSDLFVFTPGTTMADGIEAADAGWFAMEMMNL